MMDKLACPQVSKRGSAYHTSRCPSGVGYQTRAACPKHRVPNTGDRVRLRRFLTEASISGEFSRSGLKTIITMMNDECNKGRARDIYYVHFKRRLKE